MLLWPQQSPSPGQPERLANLFRQGRGGLFHSAKCYEIYYNLFSSLEPMGGQSQGTTRAGLRGVLFHFWRDLPVRSNIGQDKHTLPFD